MAAGLIDCHLLARLSAVRIYQTVSCDNHKCHERVIFCDGVPEMPEAWHGTETGVLLRDTRPAWLSMAGLLHGFRLVGVVFVLEVCHDDRSLWRGWDYNHFFPRWTKRGPVGGYGLDGLDWHQTFGCVCKELVCWLRTGLQKEIRI